MTQICLTTYRRSLLLTLHTCNQASIADCSKTLRGLRFPIEVSGLCTRIAGRYLSGKAFRYLKRVIVTPAVYWRFTELNSSFTCQHWAGVAPSTHPYGLAGSYVFIKQSNLPSHCDQLLHVAGTPYPKVTELNCRIPLAGLP